ncbi:molybdenum cofactor biosynthesis protein MoaE [Rhodospirillum rubrum]|uniref:molybdenum cofactor biosynthesis protein MoaE n=1 Tax=Rhodospirillum rubrum TaxID=1085 RepID=UPI0019059A3C|nr:molybdenum cofactor biosynthesis protein MoaE [Rhodospirillum rubrum]MBK1663881.1 molybdenum cofactor biosynthesis protein MoaE [Rhodospirillum rubrum]MBK1676720.1 molybdenum cofactor biosynthesis protein MoaE [Rhodospirillum rubrum]
MAVHVQSADFDSAAEIARFERQAALKGAGAVASFCGLVRGREGADGPLIGAMTLEHYPGMTERALAAIEAEALTRWPLTDSLIIHRFGRLEPGARIVLVCTASSHREAAFAACAFLMDWLKTKAPFWKKEETLDGPRWVEAKAEDDARAAAWNEAAPPRRPA